MPFDYQIYFDSVRDSLFNGVMTQDQVNGQGAILNHWEKYAERRDIRWLAYMLATTYHETAQQMLPVEEYNKGQGQPYGVPDPETRQTYYGRGYVQLTWRENYARADRELSLSDANSCERYAVNALTPSIAARIMYRGMAEGWFRSDSQGPQSLPRYFNASTEDPYGAREIINGDKKTIPDWSNGRSIGNMVAEYYQEFLTAVTEAQIDMPEPPDVPQVHIDVVIATSEPIAITLTINGEDIHTTAAAVELPPYKA